jgi:YidC/Oxa1 family membrane protein insertase
MLDPLYEAIGWLLSVFYSVIPNLGVAIVLLTFTIMLLLFPLTAKQARSMIRMQMVQPEIKRIQAKYKHDRAKLNEELMKFYQENKINPLAGCLPLLVQMPIFFALFHVLRNSYKYVPDTSSLYKALCTVPGNGTVATVEQCASGGRYGDILPVHQKFLGVDLSVSAPNQIGTWATFAAFALVVLVMFTGYMQSRQAQKRTPAINKQMALITKVLPVFFGFISLNFPSGLVLYFFVSNLWRLGQQEIIFRHYGTAAAPKHRSLRNPPRAEVVEAEHRDRLAGVDRTEGASADAGVAGRGANAGRAAAGPAKPAKGSGAVAAPGKPIIPPQRGGGGLRSLFQLPPPPGERAVQRPSSPAKPAPKKATPSTGTAARPGQAGRRSSKKKRKR